MKKEDQLAAWSQGFLCYPFNLQLNGMAAIAQVNVEKKTGENVSRKWLFN